MSRILADPATLLARAIVASAKAAGCDATVSASETQPWASATYSGARHRIVLDIEETPARHRWLNELDDAELPIRGHIALPPAVLASDSCGVTLEILTLEQH